MAAKKIGAFQFKDLGDGCISSKYFNGGMKHPYVECALRITPGESDPFIGTYSTTWLEEKDKAIKATLTITGNGNGLYIVEWNETPVVYHGEAMLTDGMLVGYFWWE